MRTTPSPAELVAESCKWLREFFASIGEHNRLIERRMKAILT
jgi:hypothetical protein